MDLYESVKYEDYIKDGVEVSSDAHRRKYRRLRGTTIVIEGLIGTGKSTAGFSLTRWLNCNGIKARYFPEYRNDSLLDQYIKNMPKYAYAFQIFMLQQRLHIYSEAKKFAELGGVSIIDRSLLGDFTFAKMQKQKGFFTEEEWNVYISLMKHDTEIEPDIIMYLYCSPDISFNRMKTRGIQSEIGGYTLEYFNDLHKAYECSMSDISHKIHKVPWEKNIATLTDSDGKHLLPWNSCIELLKSITSFFDNID